MPIPKPVVAFEQDDHPSLARNLERELVSSRANHVEGFTSAKDWPDFQKRRGIVEGIDIAIALCQNQQKLLSGK